MVPPMITSCGGLSRSSHSGPTLYGWDRQGARRLNSPCRALRCRRFSAEAGQPDGVAVDDMLEEARRFVARSEAEHDAACADALAQAQARGDHEAVRLLSDGWAAVRASRWALMTAEGVPCRVNHAFEVR